jgi:hypothetical protein
MEVMTVTVTEVNPEMTIDDLYLALKLSCPNAPSRTQFYVWLQLTWCNEPMPRGGKKLPKRYAQYHLNRLMCFAKLRDVYGSLTLAQSALEAEMTNNPAQYFIED